MPSQFLLLALFVHPTAEGTQPSTNGALCALPSSDTTPMKWQWYPKVLFTTCFVRRSPGFCNPGCLCNVKSPSRLRSCTHNWPTTRCRTRPMPVRRHMPIAADESANTFNPKSSPRSIATLCNPIPSADPFTIPASSASPNDKATTFWVEGQCLITCPPPH